MCNSSSNIVVVVVVAVPWHNNNVAFFCRVFSQSETFRSEKEIILRELIFFQQFFERFEETTKLKFYDLLEGPDLLLAIRVVAAQIIFHRTLFAGATYHHPPTPTSARVIASNRTMNSNTPTPHGIHHREGQTVEDIARAPPGERVLKVSQNTQTNKLATSIGFVCEHGEAPLILALGPANVNTAVKAMAIARRKLKEENVDLRLYPTFRAAGDGAKRFSAILLQTWKEEGNGDMQAEDDETDLSLTCGSNSVPSQVAGAIAGKIREGYSVSIRACGAEAVSKTVSAVTFARMFLADTEKNPPESTPLGRVVDISCAPEFRHELVGSDGQERTILLFTIKVIDPRNAPTVSMSTEASGGISVERQRRLAEDVNAAANANAAVKNGEEVSYCHQCGAVFNRMSANFCSQCGCKRS